MCRCVAQRKGADGKYSCLGKYNPNESRWEALANAPHDGFNGLWPMAWPTVGGGGALGTEIDRRTEVANKEALFGIGLYNTQLGIGPGLGPQAPAPAWDPAASSPPSPK